MFGLNCATGPSEMHEHLRHLSRYSPFPISCVPNAGLPSIVDGHTHYDLTPEQLADAHAHNVTELGITVVGGCCGTTPEHLRQLSSACGTSRRWRATPIIEPSVSSLFSAVPLRQETSYLVIGERTNANGSKAFRDALLEANWDACEDIAREQVREGSHAIDLCVDYVGRDGAPDMSELARRFAERIDARDRARLDRAARHQGGTRAPRRSRHHQLGQPRRRRRRPTRGSTRSSRSPPSSAPQSCARASTPRARPARRSGSCGPRSRSATSPSNRYGLRDEDLLFDALALSIGTGLEESRGDGAVDDRRHPSHQPGAAELLHHARPVERVVRTQPGAASRHQLGVPARVRRGGPHQRHRARRPPAAAQPHRRGRQASSRSTSSTTAARDDYDPLTILLNKFEGVKAGALEKEDRSGWPVEERLKRRIIDGDRTGLDADLDEALSTTPALDILNDTLLEGMKVVGDLFGRGEMQLPFVLQSAEAMKAAVAHLEPHMPKSADSTKGRIVLATVKGDVHDIGKNLVDIILTNNGYEVFNLGIKVPLNDMVQKAREVGADAIGMSGLLVKSTLIMRENLEELNEAGLAANTPVILGGAALTRTYVERDLREVYDGRVFYGKDAFEGLHTLDGRLVADLVRLAVADAPLDAAAGQPGGEAVGVVVAAGLVAGLRDRQAAELAAPDHQRLVEQPALGQVGQQRRRPACRSRRRTARGCP